MTKATTTQTTTTTRRVYDDDVDVADISYQSLAMFINRSMACESLFLLLLFTVSPYKVSLLWFGFVCGLQGYIVGFLNAFGTNLNPFVFVRILFIFWKFTIKTHFELSKLYCIHFQRSILIWQEHWMEINSCLYYYFYYGHYYLWHQEFNHVVRFWISRDYARWLYTFNNKAEPSNQPTNHGNKL